MKLSDWYQALDQEVISSPFGYVHQQLLLFCLSQFQLASLACFISKLVTFPTPESLVSME
jgi:hypothetical protein